MPDGFDEGLRRDREQGSIFYKKNDGQQTRVNDMRSFSPSPHLSDEAADKNSENGRMVTSPDAVSFQKTTMDDNGQ